MIYQVNNLIKVYCNQIKEDINTFFRKQIKINQNKNII